jgi:hypothetical protein
MIEQNCRERRMMREILAAALTLATTATMAAEPYIGKWASKPADCGEPLFTFSAKKVFGATFACESAKYSAEGAEWKGVATQCSTEDGKSPNMSFRLAMRDGKLQVVWDDGTKSDRLARCGR